jgi:hypothetical protein
MPATGGFFFVRSWRSPNRAPFADAAPPFAESGFRGQPPMRYRAPVLSTGAIQ